MLRSIWWTMDITRNENENIWLCFLRSINRIGLNLVIFRLFEFLLPWIQCRWYKLFVWDNRGRSFPTEIRCEFFFLIQIDLKRILGFTPIEFISIRNLDIQRITTNSIYFCFFVDNSLTTLFMIVNEFDLDMSPVERELS